MAGMGDKQRSFAVQNETAIAAELNTIYRFEIAGSEVSWKDILSAVQKQSEEPVVISVTQVIGTFQRLNVRKSLGLENISSFILKTFTEELAVA